MEATKARKLTSICSVYNDFINFEDYENEFETMRLFLDNIHWQALDILDYSSRKWIESLEDEDDDNIEYKKDTDSVKKKQSKDLREQGNRLFTAVGEKRNVLGACRLYNEAIFAALDCEEGDEVALAYGNRAMALQTFGYYQQAYDDSVCALECGYPREMHDKIVTRQAHCALKLKNINALESHLSALEAMPLNDIFKQNLKKLEEELKLLKSACNSQGNKEPPEEIEGNNEFHEIVETGNRMGRVMRAKCLIPKSQLIFTERMSAFTPTGDTLRLCHQCCITNFIPYPCLKCRGRVVYCSIKCKDDHLPVHEYECPGYRLQLFAHFVPFAHLSLRFILENGIFTILELLKTKESTEEAWNSLINGGDIWKSKVLPYAERLRLTSHLDKTTTLEIEMFAFTSNLLVSYLKHHTDFFYKLKDIGGKKCNWELLVASLILRHMGQMKVNSHTLTTIVSPPLYFTSTPFPLLNDRIWSKPWHLKPGFLHIFSHKGILGYYNLPISSMCNHSCVPTFQHKISGRYVSKFALRDLKKGDEITDRYVPDYRNMKSESRRQRLKDTYHFDCRCENCKLPNEDLAYNKYHQYRCDNKQCGRIFVPNLPNRPLLDWWEDDEADATIHCTKCRRKQRFEWWDTFITSFPTVRQSKTRRRLYQLFKSLDLILLGHSCLRAFIAKELCLEWFSLLSDGISFDEQDFSELIDMIKYMLELAKDQSGINNLTYVTKMTFLWDLVATGKHMWTNAEKEEMFFALTIISDDLKEIFLNYYNDYIKDN